MDASTGRGGLIRTVVRRPVAVSMVVAAVAVFGLVSLSKLPVNLLPDVSYPTLTVRTEYAGAAPIDVEKLVTRKLEENLAVISNLVTYRSISRAGVSDVVLEFEWDTRMTFAVQDVREKVAQLKSRLPQEVEDPLILRYDPTLDPIMRIAVYRPARASAGEDRHLYELRRVAEEDLQRKLENIPGVAAVRVRGGYEEEWRVELEEDLLKLHDVSAAQVRERVSIENVNVAGGEILDGDREILVRTVGEITTVEELRDLVVIAREGRPIRIRNLGRVVADKKERDVVTRVEGTESVEIEIFKEAGANIVEVAHAVKTRLFGARWRESLAGGEYRPGEAGADTGPKRGGGRGGDREGTTPVFEQRRRGLAADLAESGIRARVLSDQSVFIEQSLVEVREAGLVGALLAILVLYVFLRRLSPTLIIGVAIPISVVATFAPLFLTGVSLNIMSLGGLALGIGMLVDSSIVVLESITRKREEGLEVVEATVEGTRSVGTAVLASTLTTVAVFLPIVFVEGIAGEFFRDQALAVVFSLLASLVAALLFIPMLASRRLGLGAGAVPRGRRIALDLMPWRLRTYVSLGVLGGLLRRRRRLSFALVLPVEVLRLLLEVLLRTALLLLLAVAVPGALAVRWTARGLGLAMRAPLWLFDHGYRGLERGYRRLLSGALRARWLVLLLGAAAFWAAARQADDLGVELVPTVHQGEFTIESQLQVGTPLRETDRTGRRIEQAVRGALAAEGIAVAGISSSAGVARDVIAEAGDGKHTSRIHVTLAETADIAGTEERAIDAIRRRLSSLPEVRDPAFTRPALFSTGTGLEVHVIGPDLERLQAAASLLEERLQGLPELVDLRSTNRAGHPELVIVPDREQMAFYGMNPGDVADLVRSKVQGSVSTRVTRGDRKIDVLVRVPEELVDERREILNLRVNPDGERPIPLSAVARVDQRPGPAEIRRVAGERAIVLSAEVADLDLRGAARRVGEVAESLEREHPEALEGCVVRIAGQSEESERSLGSMLFALAIAVFLVYIVMASQFESLVHPLVILFSIPLALVGVVFALDWLGIELSIVVLIGVILLAGIVVNNAIVLVDCVNQFRMGGMERDAALREAGRIRFRPILMTTATTVLGLLPLALGLGEGTEIRAPMAITVIAGLSASTVLTLVFVPVVYSLLSRRGTLAQEARP